jgi:hypothetical protein
MYRIIWPLFDGVAHLADCATEAAALRLFHRLVTFDDIDVVSLSSPEGETMLVASADACRVATGDDALAEYPPRYRCLILLIRVGARKPITAERQRKSLVRAMLSHPVAQEGGMQIIVRTESAAERIVADVWVVLERRGLPSPKLTVKPHSRSLTIAFQFERQAHEDVVREELVPATRAFTLVETARPVRWKWPPMALAQAGSIG